MKTIYIVKNIHNKDVDTDVLDIINKNDGSFYIFNNKELEKKIKLWNKYFRFIIPHYAIKSNPYIPLINTLAKNNFSFDCASTHEINVIKDQNICNDRIIYANPIKTNEEVEILKQMKEKPLTVFDNVSQLKKMEKYDIDISYLIRLFVNTTDASCPFDDKYGAQPGDIKEILNYKSKNKLSFKGFSFHVGSGNKNIDSYLNAMKKVEEGIQIATEYGETTEIINIGGGLDYKNPNLNELSKLYYKYSLKYKIFAEPGRFFSEASFILKVVIVEKKIIDDWILYYIDDSTYHSFSCMIYDHLDYQKGNKGKKSKVYGKTCDGTDVIFSEIYLPELEVDDILVFPNMGAYTMCSASDFNGFLVPKVIDL
ncbi:Pyridoxal-dependent decarboxylase, pyridoxal binding domain [seawater metagenome]|uniref:Pyridoxal-dependent decarboxylase, pyridoxal binding domain n=1 Tax=seawater metagenome TaxID=1561972 RepID=A0A5E8CJG9_9ZZZZ